MSSKSKRFKLTNNKNRCVFKYPHNIFLKSAEVNTPIPTHIQSLSYSSSSLSHTSRRNAATHTRASHAHTAAQQKRERMQLRQNSRIQKITFSVCILPLCACVLHFVHAILPLSVHATLRCTPSNLKCVHATLCSARLPISSQVCACHSPLHAFQSQGCACHSPLHAFQSQVCACHSLLCTHSTLQCAVHALHCVCTTLTIVHSLNCMHCTLHLCVLHCLSYTCDSSSSSDTIRYIVYSVHSPMVSSLFLSARMYWMRPRAKT